ncbi:MAG: hypothetical protein ACI4WT_13990 [Oligosphaeraceae bacterium]
MMNQNSELDDVTIIGKLDLYEDPETGNDLVAVYTKEGEEYVISNRKMARRLMPFTEDDIDVRFEGTVKVDPYSRIKILTVKSYEPLQELMQLASDRMRREGHAQLTPDFPGDDPGDYIPDENDRRSFDDDLLDGDQDGDGFEDADFSDEEELGEESDEERSRLEQALAAVLQSAPSDEKPSDEKPAAKAKSKSKAKEKDASEDKGKGKAKEASSKPRAKKK